MDQPIDDCDGNHVVREHLGPGAERLVGGDPIAARLVAVSDELEQHRGLCFGGFDVADVIDHE